MYVCFFFPIETFSHLPLLDPCPTVLCVMFAHEPDRSTTAQLDGARWTRSGTGAVWQCGRCSIRSLNVL
jgi:hypothetical protein